MSRFSNFSRLKAAARGLIALPVLAAIALATPAAADVEGEKRANQYFKKMLSKPGVSGNWASADMEDGAVVIRKLVLKTEAMDGKPAFEVTVDEVRLAKYDWDNVDLPHYSDIEWKGIRVPTAAMEPEGRQFMNVAGIETLTLNIRGNHKYDAATKVLSVGNMVVQAEKLFTITLQAGFNDVDLAAIQKLIDAPAGQTNNAAGPMALLSTLKVSGLKLAIKDDGIMDAAMKMQGQQKKMTAQQVQAQMLAGLNFMMSQNKNPVVVDMLKAVTQFVQDKGTLTLTMAPEKPVALMMFMPMAMSKGEQQAQMMRMMGLKVTATK